MYLNTNTRFAPRRQFGGLDPAYKTRDDFG